MDNDINTSLAITALYDVLKSDANDATKRALINDFDRVLSLDLLKAADELLNADDNGTDDELAAKVNELIAKRAEAKKAKDFAQADKIRDELKEMGIIIKDTAQGVVWEKA